jgi:dienelactone hydrolase
MTITRILPAVLAAALAAFISTAPAQAEMKKGWLDYTHGSKKLKGYVVHDDAVQGKRPAILMIHGQDGMSANTQLLTETWAKLGYVAFAADIFGYGEGILPTGKEMSVHTSIYRKDRALMRARTQAGYDAITKHPLVDASRVALIGYCFGGSVGVEFGSTGAPLLLNVAIHGSFGGHEPGWAKTVKGMFLILHGAEDKGYPLATAVVPVLDELRAAKVPFQLEVYSGAGHGFYRPVGPDNERALRQANASAGRMLKDVFDGRGS